MKTARCAINEPFTGLASLGLTIVEVYSGSVVAAQAQSRVPRKRVAGELSSSSRQMTLTRKRPLNRGSSLWYRSVEQNGNIVNPSVHPDLRISTRTGQNQN